MRPSSAADADLIYSINELTLKAHVDAVGRRWATARMRDKCINDAIDPGTRIVQVDGVDCGVFQLEIADDAVWLHAMLLIPEYQRRGIGRQLLARTVREADARGVPVRLLVMRANPARAYYERFGFRVIEEAEQHFAMERAA